MINESVKKSLEKSKNVLAEKRKIVKQKNCIKNTHTFTIISINFVQEQLLTSQRDCCISFRGLHINTASTIKLIHKKRNHQEINFFGPNRAIYMRHSVGNTFPKPSHSLNAVHDKNLLSIRRNKFTDFRFQAKTPSEQIVRSVYPQFK